VYHIVRLPTRYSAGRTNYNFTATLRSRVRTFCFLYLLINYSSMRSLCHRRMPILCGRGNRLDGTSISNIDWLIDRLIDWLKNMPIFPQHHVVQCHITCKILLILLRGLCLKYLPIQLITFVSVCWLHWLPDILWVSWDSTYEHCNDRLFEQFLEELFFLDKAVYVRIRIIYNSGSEQQRPQMP